MKCTIQIRQELSLCDVRIEPVGKYRTKIGLLGCGGIAAAHVSGFDKVKDEVEVVAVAEPNMARHGQIRQWFGSDVTIFDDYHDVLKMDEIRAVDIVLPHDLHMPATVAAAKAGKHVLVEKVMARNVWECDRMIEASDKNEVTLTIAHDRRYHGEWEAMKDIVDSGILGEIHFWKLDHNQDVLPPPGHWIRTKDGIGGGAIMSCLTHQIDALRWYGGEVESVNCMTRVIPERMEGEFLGLMSARMQSGALAELSINWWTRSNAGNNALWYEMVQVCGSKGEAYRMSGRGTFIRLHDDSNKNAIEKYGANVVDEFVEVPNAPHSGHEKCITEWSKSLRGNGRGIIRTSGRECRGTVEVAEAAYLAEKEDRTIHLPIEPKPWVDSSDPEQIKKQFAAEMSSTEERNPDNPLAT
jgi:UDP-N-acetyl-2-amino-2-deoxyglucuronate dehydrogenase